MKTIYHDNHVVLTTIFAPSMLWALLENVSRYGHLESTTCWVIGDRKTPQSCADICEEVTRRGLAVRFVDIHQQDRWGDRFPEVYEYIPYDNESRRNIGYLMALEEGCARLILMDDDNFPAEDDFVGSHEFTGSTWEGDVVQENTGFHNICEKLKVEPHRGLYPRGFPFKLRNTLNTNARVKPSGLARIGVTTGLWLQDPDIDAVTWLNGTVRSIGYEGPDQVVLGDGTWTPINTQNTSVVRELIPAFLCVPMGYEMGGTRLERYGDVWGGYIGQSTLRDKGYVVAFGKPLVEHRRNPHDYVDDLRHEFWGMVLTDWLVNSLREGFVPGEDAIVGRLLELADFLSSELVSEVPEWAPKEVEEFLVTTSRFLRAWAGTCEGLL